MNKKLSVCFLSNYLTHHQLPFCLALYGKPNVDFYFIETEILPDERKELGYQNLGEKYDFVITANTSDNIQKVKALADNCDVLIIGSAPNSFIKNRIKKNKLTFRYAERVFKKREFDLPRWFKHFRINFPHRHKEFYYLFSSAYAAKDYVKFGAKENKMYKWGYFPETKKYESIERVIEKKQKASILWVARFISWKHPEIAVAVAKKLKSDGYEFSLDMIGVGPLLENIKELIKKEGLEKEVKLLGGMPPEEVREHMERSEIFLFTSDKNEGWGAVLNEAMNSGCTVVANKEIGSVPFLIKDDENGLTCKGNDADKMYGKVKYLLDNERIRKDMGLKAYKTIMEEWNAEVAADRLLKFIESGKYKSNGMFKDGPCSIAFIIK